MDLNESQTEAAAVDTISASKQETRQIGDTPVVLLPHGYSVADLSSKLPAPTRKRGTTTLNDAESFIAVVQDQSNDSTRLFSTINPPTFTAVFNHIADGAGWGDHRAKYDAPLSPEWLSWTKANTVKMGQLDMAQFLETNMVDVVHITADAGIGELGSPDGATLLEICRTLEAKKKVNFKSSVRLPNGSTEFTYDEEVNGSAIKGTMAIPEQFTVGIPVFENGEKYRQDVRFRYRIQDGGHLAIWLELIRPHKVIEDAVKQLRERIASETGLQVLNGTASS